jgi:hypothetical protein
MDKLEVIARLKDTIMGHYNIIYRGDYPLRPSELELIKKEIDDINDIIKEIRESK